MMAHRPSATRSLNECILRAIVVMWPDLGPSWWTARRNPPIASVVDQASRETPLTWSS